MKRLKQYICVILCCAFLCCYLPTYSAAVSTENSSNDISISDDFSDNCVLVILTNEASLKYKDYTPSDFPEIKCSKVENITKYVGNTIKYKAATITSAASQQKPIDDTLLSTVTTLDIGDYHQILYLELAKPGKKEVIKAIRKLEKRTDIECVTPDYTIHTSAAVSPSDPLKTQQWATSKIELDEAWSICTGSSSVRVGVVDTGIDSTHPDLAKRINKGISLTFLDNSISGTHEPTPTDPGGHGTHVAGIIGAAGNNMTGIAGVCWNVELVSLKVLDSDGNGQLYHLGNAINAADELGIDILNISISTNKDTNSFLRYAIQNYTGLVVCGASNEGTDNDEIPRYPSVYNDLPNVISVGASQSDDTIASFSNTGETTVDLFAPGVDILSCYPTSKCASPPCNDGYSLHYSTGYHTMSGTSMACPYVTGVAALLLSEYPNLTPREIKATIMDNVDIVYNSYDTDVFGGRCVSGGRLNAYAALTSISHSYTYTSLNSTQHTCICSDCGHSQTEGHSLGYSEGTSSGHTYSCSQCGWSSMETHTFSYEQSTPSAHTIMCTKCSYSASQAHVWGGSPSPYVPCAASNPTYPSTP